MDCSLEINNLTKSLNKSNIIRELNLSISKGKKVALLGLNGAGKSSFIRLLTGESKPDNGEIIYRSYDASFNSGSSKSLLPNELYFKKHLGYQADTMLAIAGMTGGEYLTLCGQFKQLSSKQIERELKALCQKWQIDALLVQKMSKLSKGNLQRLAIAQVFITEPKWLFFDEPCQSLDPLEQDRFNQNIKSLEDIELCIFSTHNVEHALEVADDIVVFHQSQIAYHFKKENRKKYLLVTKKVSAKLSDLENSNESEFEIKKTHQGLFQINALNLKKSDDLIEKIGKENIEFCLPEFEAVMPLFRMLASGEIDLCELNNG